LQITTAQEMHDLGFTLGQLLRAGDVLVLTGPLGAGKTTLTKGIGAGLEIQDVVTSPTFVFAKVHRGGRELLVHVDAYRLTSVDDFDALDLESLGPQVLVMEWGAAFVEAIADEWLELQISRADDESREVTFMPHGARFAALVAQVTK
jgi:tRNA threonylcarbamoyladenosine biosynthesis protein TsaE